MISSLTHPTSFIFSFFTPYLLNAPYADLGSRVGFIFGALAVCSFAFAYFCVPEMKGKSLEDINQLFEDGVAIRQFGRANPTGGEGSTTWSSPDGKDETIVKEEGQLSKE
jgi:hypothetical protein